MWQKLGRKCRSWKADKMIKNNELSHSSAVQKKADEEGARNKLIIFLGEAYL